MANEEDEPNSSPSKAIETNSRASVGRVGADPCSGIWLGPSKRDATYILAFLRVPAILLAVACILTFFVGRINERVPAGAGLTLVFINWIAFPAWPTLSRFLSRLIVVSNITLEAVPPYEGVRFVVSMRKPRRSRERVWAYVLLPSLLLWGFTLAAGATGGNPLWIIFIPALLLTVAIPLWDILEDIAELRAFSVVSLSGFSDSLTFAIKDRFDRADAVSECRGKALSHGTQLLRDPFGGLPLGAMLLSRSAAGKQALVDAGFRIVDDA